MGRQKEILEKLAQTFQIRHVLIRQGLAECLGTLVLVVSKEISLFLFFCASCWLPRVSVCLKGKVADRAKNKITTSQSGCDFFVVFFSHIKTEINFWEHLKNWPCLRLLGNIKRLHGFYEHKPTSCKNNNNNRKEIWIETFYQSRRERRRPQVIIHRV